MLNLALRTNFKFTVLAHGGYSLDTCPPGVPSIELNPLQNESYVAPRGSLAPRVYARPLQVGLHEDWVDVESSSLHISV